MSGGIPDEVSGKGSGESGASLTDRLTSALSSNPVPPAWGLALAGLAGGGLGFATGAAIDGPSATAVGASMTALFVTITGLAAPRGGRAKAVPVIATIVLTGRMLAHVSTGDPVVAGLAMAAVMFLSAIGFAGGPIAAVVGSLLGMAYFIPAVIGYTTGLSTSDTLVVGLLGIGASLLTVAALSRVVEPPAPAGGPPTQEKAPVGASPLARIFDAARTSSAIRAYAIRRAIVVGAAVGAYQATGNHNAFWVALTVFVVLGPDESSTWDKALTRSAGTIAGALFLGALAQVLPADAVIAIGVIALLVGIGFFQRNYAVYSAGIAMVVVALFGAGDDQFLTWAGLRILDTVAGATIAIASLYLIPYRGGDGPVEGSATDPTA